MALDQKKVQAKKAKRNAKNKSRLEKSKIYTHIAKSPYPRIIFAGYDKSSVSEEFVANVRSAVKSFSYENELLDDMDRDFYRLMKKHGYHHAFADLASRAEQGLHSIIKSETDEPFKIVPDFTRLSVHYGFQIGNILFQHLKEKGVLEKYLPTHDLQINPQQDFLVELRALLSYKDRSNTTLYYSWKKPQVEIENKKYVVSFSKHALERIAERCVVDPLSYGGSGDVFAFLAHCTYFEPTKIINLDGNSVDGIVLYNSCGKPPFFSYSYVKYLIDKDEVDSQKIYHYRLGYCPIVLSGDFAKATTFLTPGMYGTPEHETIETIRDEKERNAISRSKENITSLKKHGETNDFIALKFFHEHAIPQVVAFDKDIYNYT